MLEIYWWLKIFNSLTKQIYQRIDDHWRAAWKKEIFLWFALATVQFIVNICWTHHWSYMGIDSEIHIVLTLSIHLYWNWSKRFELGIVNYPILALSCAGSVRWPLFHISMLLCSTSAGFLAAFFSLAHQLIYVYRMAILWNWWIDNDLSLFYYFWWSVVPHLRST